MSAVRIDAGAVWTAVDQFVVNYGGAGDVTLTLRTHPNYIALHAKDIGQHIHERLQTVNAALSCAESDGIFTIASSGSTFNITLGNQSLRTVLNVASAASGVTSHVSTSTAPVVFLGSRPAVITSGTRWHVRRSGIHRGRGRSLKILKRRFWKVDLRIRNSEAEQWNKVARYLLQGQPFSIFQDTATIPGTTWDYSAPTKNLKGLMLDGAAVGFEYQPMSTPFHDEFTVSFDVVEYAG